MRICDIVIISSFVVNFPYSILRKIMNMTKLIDEDFHQFGDVRPVGNATKVHVDSR